MFLKEKAYSIYQFFNPEFIIKKSKHWLARNNLATRAIYVIAKRTKTIKQKKKKITRATNPVVKRMEK